MGINNKSMDCYLTIHIGEVYVELLLIIISKYCLNCSMYVYQQTDKFVEIILH